MVIVTVITHPCRGNIYFYLVLKEFALLDAQGAEKTCGSGMADEYAHAYSALDWQTGSLLRGQHVRLGPPCIAETRGSREIRMSILVREGNRTACAKTRVDVAGMQRIVRTGSFDRERTELLHQHPVFSLPRQANAPKEAACAARRPGGTLFEMSRSSPQLRKSKRPEQGPRAKALMLMWTDLLGEVSPRVFLFSICSCTTWMASAVGCRGAKKSHEI